MSEIGVLVKVPAELHAEFKRASARHQRSMQKVMLALLEGWLENGTPDPLNYGKAQTNAPNQNIEDKEAREALLRLAAEVSKIEKRLEEIEADKATKEEESSSFKKTLDLLKQLGEVYPSIQQTSSKT